MAEPTLFERIVAREIPATSCTKTTGSSRSATSRRKAPVHLLVVPKTARVPRTSSSSPRAIRSCSPSIVAVAQHLADEHADGEFRLVFNTGADAGQTVFHVHAHVLAAGDDSTEGSLGF